LCGELDEIGKLVYMTHPERIKRPTISDVAVLAGVSKGAVSRALNGGQGISESTIARIRAAALELDWVPSSAARAVGGGPAGAVGLVLRRPAELLEADPFFPAFLSGVETVLSEAGLAAVVRFVSDAASERGSFVSLFRERRVDGFLLTDLRQRDPRYEWLQEIGAPAVVAGSPPANCPFPSVGTGSDDETRALVQHLVDQGHRRIAHVSGPPALGHAKRRARIFVDTIKRAGLEPGPVLDGEFSAAGSVRATRNLLALAQRPTAIFYANDIMAIAGMSVIAESDLRIPEDIAVAGFDGISLASYVVPSLTTVICDYRAMGAVATRMLLSDLRGVREPATTTRVGAQLVIRNSSTRTPNGAKSNEAPAFRP
jgi:DNA-binding LacI/PurR family transcriptional regulator